MGKKREAIAERSQLHPFVDAEWEAEMDMFALGARSASATNPTVVGDAYARWCLGSDSFHRKSKFVRQSAWYNIIEVGHDRDHSFQAARKLVRVVVIIITTMTTTTTTTTNTTTTLDTRTTAAPELYSDVPGGPSQHRRH